MIKVNKLDCKNNTAVCVFENIPADFNEILQRIINECNSTSFKFSSGKYENLTIKQAIYKDGKEAVFFIHKILPFTKDPQYYNSIVDTLKFFIKREKDKYSLEDVLNLRLALEDEINEYEHCFSINLEAEITTLDEETKKRIRDYILY